MTHSSPEMVMDGRWHWQGFARSLRTQHLREKVNDLMLTLPEARRTVWIRASRDEGAGELHSREHIIPYAGLASIDETIGLIEAIPSDRWINVMLACRFPKEECDSRQADAVADFRNPIIRANEIRQLVADETQLIP